MCITGGSVLFGRTVQPAQYESKKAEVTIHFAVEDGATEAAVQGIIDQASTMAHAKALELVGLAAEAKPTTAKKTTVKPTAEAKTETVTVAPKGKSKADLEAENLASLEGKPQISTGGERKGPAQADPDGLDGDVLDLGTKSYSDKDLTDTVSRVMGVIKDPGKIKGVRAKYTTGAIATIARDKRAQFIADIEALLPAK